MIRSNLHLRPLPQTTTLLYLHVEKARRQDNRLWEHAGPLAEPCLGCKQLPGLRHMGIRGCVGEMAVGRSHLTGTHHPTAPFDHTQPPTIAQHGPLWKPLPSPSSESLPRYVVCPVTLDHKEIWVWSSQHKNSPTITDQKSPRKARVRYLGNSVRTSMPGHSFQHALCFLPLTALRFLKPRMSTL